MRNIRCVISYDGSRYNGWQKQGNTDNTIQERIEQMFDKVLGESVEIHGAGRTDAGVHARGQVFHFHTDNPMPVQQMLQEANRYLPKDMCLLSAVEAAQRFHSRLNATRKWYRYVIDLAECPDVFARKYTWQLPQNLDIERMRTAAERLSGTHDYKSFCSNKRMKKSTVRTVYEIRITKTEPAENDFEGEKLYLDFYGDGFLYNMVRILTGTLVEVGLRKKEPEQMTEILDAGNRERAGMTAPAQGLFLMRVFYE